MVHHFFFRFYSCLALELSVETFLRNPIQDIRQSSKMMSASPETCTFAEGKPGNVISGKVGLGNLYCRQSLQETSPAPLLLDHWLSSKAALTYLLETSK